MHDRYADAVAETPRLEGERGRDARIREVSHLALTRWLPALLVRLQEGEPSVRRLFAVDPFGDDPPGFVRACVFRYRFAGPEARARGLVRERELVCEFSVAPAELRVARGAGFLR